jgi:peptide/nickel transport system substrate-binding protein
MSTAAAAVTVRIATAFDPQTMDPHALALLYHSRVVYQIYESLVTRDEKFKLEPALAESWQAVDAKTWRFKIRQGVTFHDGTPFTVDDAVFSIKRAMTAPSQRSFQMKGVLGTKRIDEQTLEVQLEAPDAVLPEKFIFLPMMSRAWSEKNKVEVAQDFNGKQETYAVRNANGTGPFMLDRYEPGYSRGAEAQSALVGLERQALGQRRRSDLADRALRRDPARRADLGRCRDAARSADSPTSRG